MKCELCGKEVTKEEYEDERYGYCYECARARPAEGLQPRFQQLHGLDRLLSAGRPFPETHVKPKKITVSALSLLYELAGITREIAILFLLQE